MAQLDLDAAAASAQPAVQPGLPDRLLGWLCAALNAAGTVLIGFIMVVINVDVFGRFLFGKPLTGVTEMVIASIAAIVFLQFADTLRAGRIIQADALLRLLQARLPRGYHALQALFHLLGALTFSVILYATVPFLQRAIASGDTYGNPAVFSLPKWPVRAIMIVGCAAVLLQFLLLAWRHLEAVWGERK
ncbi:TRAP transporter small permease [Variovorax sp.]|uniref:TRAP transporter small permease subunit n=1 Tax=Variovorax sp. TaxID=1871043 RepID=UPI002D73645C|nr:TRAP transporter small permease [Variovorax sp.]HYP85490.1 TRAP transporter small permease [Variovorax sp.]